MPRRRGKKAAGLTTAALLAGLLLSAAPASADCVYAEAAYQRPGQTKQYVVGPKKCVVQTPLSPFVSPFVGPVGHDSVIFVEARLWVPAP